MYVTEEIRQKQKERNQKMPKGRDNTSERTATQEKAIAEETRKKKINTRQG
jgi:hypothetical protein